ncbi:hypothetical protein Plhal710r2_c006g0029431 [Plasmopara halstedii]
MLSRATHILGLNSVSSRLEVRLRPPGPLSSCGDDALGKLLAHSAWLRSSLGVAWRRCWSGGGAVSFELDCLD